jgi:4-hydroxythreonine-4-phosphate dehydrogenase
MIPAPIAPIAVSLGDPAGIGPEVVAKCWDHRSAFNLPVFVAVGDGRSLSAVWDGPIVTIDDPRDADSAFDVGLPLLHIAAPSPDIPGQPTVAGAHCSLDSLELAVGLARSASASAVVTGPVSKQQLYAIGFSHPGQTEFVAERCGVASENVAYDACRPDAADGAGQPLMYLSPWCPTN